MHYIYVLQNKINLKIYVGQTNNLAKRRRAHKAKDRLKTKGSPLYCSIAKYGFDNFTMTEIESFENPNEADDAEVFWIEFFQSTNRELGYNLAKGGHVNHGFKHSESFKIKRSLEMKEYYTKNRQHNCKLSIEEVNQIRRMFLEEHCSIRCLGKKFSINEKTISKIIRNSSYKDNNYIPPENIRDI